ncbi:MAG TPA: DUF2207 domain-containing protein, partial [Terrimesophilobacter sp.]|nr:DUF2207 domain-containing protein [Terrimesophilobacter sp.]
MISRLVKSMVAVGIVAIALAGCSTGSGAEHISHFDIRYTIDADGTVHVVETIDYDFAGSDERHGIDRFLASRFSTAEPGRDRVYRYSDIEVESPTGASALFSTTLGNALQIRIGNKNALVHGEQTWVIRYDIDGALNRAEQPNGTIMDEFYWNATGSYWDPSIDRTTVSVTGPAPVGSAICFAGYSGTHDACTGASIAGDTATFEQGLLSSAQGLTISVAWPEGTFTGTDPILEASLPPGSAPVVSGSNDGPDPFWSPWNWGTGLALAFVVPLAFRILVLARRRDRKFLGVTPGGIPDDQEHAEIGPAPADETIVVQYQPPKGLPVGAAGTVLNKKRKNSDITATLVDLAVRGHLRIEEVEGGNRRKAKDYTLVASPERAAEKKARSRPGGPDAAELLPHEALLLGKLFPGYRTSVRLSTLTNT